MKHTLWKVWLGIYGVRTGLALAAVVLFWDIFWIGGRNLFHWSICWKGILILIFAGLLIQFGNYYKDR